VSCRRAPSHTAHVRRAQRGGPPHSQFRAHRYGASRGYSVTAWRSPQQFIGRTRSISRTSHLQAHAVRNAIHSSRKTSQTRLVATDTRCRWLFAADSDGQREFPPPARKAFAAIRP